MVRSTSTRNWAVVALTVILLAGSGVAPAAAVGDPGTPTTPVTSLQDSRHCLLTRIGTQFVRCDDLTGAGVAAPWWVPES